jgi:glycosyltransferase involved in cell wall biosynthesis
MSQNMLPFEPRELFRFFPSRMFLRLLLLRFAQAHSMRNAQGIIFLTDYGHTRIRQAIGTFSGESTVIPHGISTGFFHAPRPQEPITNYHSGRPFKLLYVSIVDAYKHQWVVAKAVAELRGAGLPIALDLIGPAYPPAMRRLNRTTARVDPRAEFIRYRGPVAHGELPTYLRSADAFVFASSCENLPIILLEAMAAGLPIACSNRGPMPEVLKDGGVYFDPTDAEDVASAIRRLVTNPQLRAESTRLSSEYARQHSWDRCADAILRFLGEVWRRFHYA